MDINRVVRDTIAEIGYTNTEYGFLLRPSEVHPSLVEQSPDIAQGCQRSSGSSWECRSRSIDLIGAGDQGLMFGFAVDETQELMPFQSHSATSWFVVWQSFVSLVKSAIFVLMLSHRLLLSMMKMTILGVDTVVISTQHDPEVSNEEIHRDVIDKVIKAVIPAQYLDEKTKFFINPTGRFVIGGPQGDSGLTGRKIIVILMAVTLVTVAVPSLVRMQPRSIAQLHTQPATSLKTSWLLDWPRKQKCS